MITYLKKIGLSLANPSPIRAKHFVFRSILRAPIIFDILNISIQYFGQRRFEQYKKLKSIDAYHQQVLEYNIAVPKSKKFISSRRPEEIYDLLTTFSGKSTIQENKILIIGARSLHELFIAWLYGYSWKNIHGADLFSCHPKITETNMEDLCFEPSSFDCIAMSATLSYAKDVFKALEECTRVLRLNGRLCFQATYDPGNIQWHGDKVDGSAISEFCRDNLKLEENCHFKRTKINSAGRQQIEHYFLFSRTGSSVQDQ
tara:strand:- start:246 stop:1019 length:774 start_codon:yes stop_codon:yes gene_type:complete